MLIRPQSSFSHSTRIIASLLLGLTLILTSTSGFAEKSIKVGSLAPDWILSNSQNENVSFYRENPSNKSVLLFWATWCPYCKALMPQLEKLRVELNDPSITFYALNIWEDADPVAFLQEKEYKFTLLLNADKVAKRYEVNGTPGLFVTDKNKRIIYMRGKGEKPEAVYEAIKSALTSQ